MCDTIPQNTPQKQCTKCKVWKPATTEYFPSRANRKSGLQSRCKQCRNDANRQIYAKKHSKHPIPDGYKRCTVCKVIKTSTTVHFTRHSQQRDGLRSQCKECDANQRREIALKRQSVRESSRPYPQGYMQCTRCRQIKPHTSEYFHFGPASTLKTQCRKCRNAYARRRYTRLRSSKGPITHGYKQCRQCQEVKPATSEFFYRKHGKFMGSCKECYDAYSPLQREAQREYNRNYYQAHKEEKRMWRQVYYQAHRSIYTAYSRNRRARLKSVPGEHTSQQIREQYLRQHGKCYYCRKHVKWKQHHVDHTFPLSRVAGFDIPANDISYLVITCKTCNLTKNDKFPWEWPEGGRLL